MYNANFVHEEYWHVFEAKKNGVSLKISACFYANIKGWGIREKGKLKRKKENKSVA